MPLLLIEGTAWPGMGPPRRGPLRPLRPAWSPRKLRANREVPVWAQDGGTERLRMDAEVWKARAPAWRVRQGYPETSPACGIVPTASPWLTTFRHLNGCLHEPSQSQLPCFPPPAASAYPT
ncbi:dexamethasone-induced protein isoform X1 [Moschus berezovskii]|uniref:dexamethasone-induced protein isoform X1 n=1 Tax=Moschus berezovskii TaxID=68408 RepID=UPI0024442AE4|nr:dexamethasone-induced protein isoform X1 [Moschus berezovskii]